LPPPSTRPSTRAVSLRAELRGLRSGQLWLVLATTACITGGVLASYGYISPLLTERTGLPEAAIPIALVVFGAGSVIGSIVGGRLGDRRPFATALAVGVVTLAATIAVALTSTSPVLVLVSFAVLGLVGFSANPILVALASRLGGDAPNLSTAMPTATFNLGTAIGTGIAAASLNGPLGPLGPVTVGIVAAALMLIPLTALALRSRTRIPDHPRTPAVREPAH
jgi:predicted MFS family arabinose efflux permease